MTSNYNDSQLSLTPLGAGDLIDRAVRLYRKNFWTFLKIATPPVIATAIGSVMTSIGWRELFVTDKSLSALVYTLLLIGGFIFNLCGYLSILIVMGGASRNLVRHLLWKEPITIKETYNNVKARFWSLLFSSMLIGIILLFAFFFIFYAWAIVFGIVMFVASTIAATGGLLGVIIGGLLGTILGIASTIGALYLFFLLASRFAYVPQVIMVEGQSISSGISRSMTLAKGNVKRLAALVIFTIFAVYSALMILMMPVIWYAYLNGIELFSFNPEATPIWWSITFQMISQISLILISPILMLGLSLLYVDERVRHEGYDIELMAARQLGEIPALPQQYLNPLHPALSQTAAQSQRSFVPPPPQSSSITTLGLK